MPERPGPWDLLDQPSDPVVADLPEVDSRLEYFRSLAEEMRTQGQRLHAISTGEELQGKYADALRSSAGEVSKDLDQVVGRYEAVVRALTEYRPALDAGLRGSAQALDEAVDADRAAKAAEAMPTATAPHGGHLTAAQEQANRDKAAAAGAAADRLDAAKAKLSSVLSALDSAGQAAAATIRKGFDDGLTDSAWDKFKYAFEQFLKILVKVLTYVGMALAAIALVIPGVGELVLAAGAAIGAVTVAANVALKAMGDGSWADLGISIAGLLTFGAAKLAGPAIQAGLKSIVGAVRGAGSTGADAVEDVGADASGAIEDIENAGSRAASDVTDGTEDLGSVGGVDAADAGNAPALTGEMEEQIGYLPRAFQRQGDGLTFNHPSAPGEDLQFRGEDPETLAPQFTVSRTGENVIWDADKPGFTKPDGSPADFTSYHGDVPTNHFLVRGFEGKELGTVDNLDDLARLSDGKTPLLVRTDQLPQNLRDDLDPGRVSSIEQAFKDGKSLPPVGLLRGDLSLSDGNHRIAAARNLGLPFIPTIVA